MFPSKKYSLIYADPPWQYSNQLGDQAKWGAATSAYPCMSVGELCSLAVRDIAAENCSLVMWTTGPKQVEAHEVLKAWGFKFVTIFYVWIKVNINASPPFSYKDIRIGRGQYTKPNAEFAFLAKKGYALDVYDNYTVPQIITAPIQDHSRKPVQARLGLERLFGDVSRIELFARDRALGWDAWGNEI